MYPHFTKKADIVFVRINLLLTKQKSRIKPRYSVTDFNANHFSYVQLFFNNNILVNKACESRTPIVEHRA